MVESGNYFNTTLNYQPWFQHPPLTMWLISLSYRVWGISPFAARFPSILLALLSAILVYSMGKRFTSSSTGGLLSSLCLLASPAYHLMVRDAKLDMVLLFFVTLAFYAYSKAIESHEATTSLSAFTSGEAQKSHGRRRMWVYLTLLYLSLGLGFLTKGPVGIVFPFIPISIHWYIKRREINLPKISLLWGIFLIGVVVFPWYFYMYKTQGFFFLKRIIFEQNFKRFFTTHYTESYSPLYYLHTFAWAFLPFLLPFLASLRSAFREFRKNRTMGDVYLIPLLWFFIPFILMSFSSSKLPHYIFPILPAAALLAGNYLWKIIREKETSTPLLVSQFLVLALILSLFLALNFIFFPLLSSFPFWFTFSLFISLSIAGLLALRLRSQILLTSAIVLAMGTLNFSLNFHVDPSLLKYQPSRYFAGNLQGDYPLIYTYKFFPNASLIFYLRKKVTKLSGKELERLLEKNPGKEFVIIFPAKEVKKMREKGYVIRPLSIRSYYPVSRLSLQFLDLRKREKISRDIILGKIRLKQRVENNL
ncbi:MAG: phospholipid carrier-dependent glycosyltransferase [Caldiserica bacterium]|nr:phospholipid carrier-dependent glycosyltransferase [Caldisericota bacterium]